MAAKKKPASDEISTPEQEAEALQDFTVIDGFELVDPAKLERVIFGTTGRTGEPEGGLGADADPKLVLATYDKLGGLIRKDGIKIKTGSFWNFDRRVRAMRETPKVSFLFNIGGETVEVDDPAKLSEAIMTVERARQEKEEKFRKKRAEKDAEDRTGE